MYYLKDIEDWSYQVESEVKPAVGRGMLCFQFVLVPILWPYPVLMKNCSPACLSHSQNYRPKGSLSILVGIG